MYNIDDISINFFQTQHSIKTYAMNVIKDNLKIFYSADTGYDKNITTFLNNSDILIFEASF